MNPWDNLIIRQCKREEFSTILLQRVIGKKTDRYHDNVNEYEIVDYLTRIVIKYDLVSHWGDFFDHKMKYYESLEKHSYLDDVIQELRSIVYNTRVSKLVGYVSSYRHRNYNYMTTTQKHLYDLYHSYVNDYITIDLMSEHHGVESNLMRLMIEEGRHVYVSHVEG